MQAEQILEPFSLCIYFFCSAPKKAAQRSSHPRLRWSTTWSTTTSSVVKKLPERWKKRLHQEVRRQLTQSVASSSARTQGAQSPTTFGATWYHFLHNQAFTVEKEMALAPY